MATDEWANGKTFARQVSEFAFGEMPPDAVARLGVSASELDVLDPGAGELVMSRAALEAARARGGLRQLCDLASLLRGSHVSLGSLSEKGVTDVVVEPSPGSLSLVSVRTGAGEASVEGIRSIEPADLEYMLENSVRADGVVRTTPDAASWATERAVTGGPDEGPGTDPYAIRYVDGGDDGPSVGERVRERLGIAGEYLLGIVGPDNVWGPVPDEGVLDVLREPEDLWSPGLGVLLVPFDDGTVDVYEGVGEEELRRALEACGPDAALADAAEHLDKPTLLGADSVRLSDRERAAAVSALVADANGGGRPFLRGADALRAMREADGLSWAKSLPAPGAAHVRPFGDTVDLMGRDGDFLAVTPSAFVRCVGTPGFSGTEAQVLTNLTEDDWRSIEGFERSCEQGDPVMDDHLTSRLRYDAAHIPLCLESGREAVGSLAQVMTCETERNLSEVAGERLEELSANRQGQAVTCGRGFGSFEVLDAVGGSRAKPRATSPSDERPAPPRASSIISQATRERLGVAPGQGRAPGRRV